MNAPRRNLAAVGRWGAARKAASRSGSTRKTDSLAGIRKSSSQGTAARRDSRGGSTRTSGSLAGFEGRLDEQGMAARQVCDGSSRGGFTRRVRAPGFAITFTRDSSQSRPHAGLEGRLDAQGGVARQDSQGGSTRKADRAQKRRRSEERRLPRKTTGANQIRPES